MGSDCTYKRADCHETCEICLYPNLNECIICKDGFTLVNGYCVPCADCCATCEPANGTAANQCTSCPEGFGLDDGNMCRPCHPSCKTCSGAYYDSECTSCHEDSTLGTNNYCLCDFPKMRLLSSSTCENACPSGTTYHNADNHCHRPHTEAAAALDPAIYFTLEL